jgi:hypothetical protein
MPQSPDHFRIIPTWFLPLPSGAAMATDDGFGGASGATVLWYRWDMN